MEIQRITIDVLTFQVETYIQTEGGMDHDTFGPVTHTPQDAIRQLELAQAARPKCDWIIQMIVETKTQVKKV